MDDREQLLGASASESSLDSPFDWTYEELHGRATGDYFPLEEDEILLSKGMYKVAIIGQFHLVSIHPLRMTGFVCPRG